MKRALVTTGLAALLLLTGCTSTVTTESVTVTPSASGTYNDGGVAVEVQPLTAETPEPSDADATYLEAVRANLRPDNVIPNATDEQLLTAGEAACEKIATTENTNTISVIEGEQPNGLGSYPDSNVIVSAARASLCG